MPSFFRTVTVPATDAAQRADAIRCLRREEFEGILLRDVYNPTACADLCAKLEEGRHGLVRTNFPAPFHAFFFGMNLNLTPPDLTGYF
jgi:hypothetical protein